MEYTNSGSSESERWLLQTERFSVERVCRELPNGQRRTREVIRHPGAVVILPMVDDDHVCLIENYRVAVGRSLFELPAGTLDAGEDPLEAAVRELAEETGYRGGTWSPMHSFLVSPGILDERMHLFRAIGLEPGPPAREPGEEIQNQVVSWNEAMAMVQRGEIEDAKTLIGLLLADRDRSA